MLGNFEMIERFSDSFARSLPREIEMLMKLLGVVVEAGDAYKNLISAQSTSLLRYEQRKALLERGHFSLLDLNQLMISVAPDQGGTNPRTVAELLKRLVEWSLIIDNDTGTTSIIDINGTRHRS